jgi:hypothetical protein
MRKYRTDRPIDLFSCEAKADLAEAALAAASDGEAWSSTNAADGAETDVADVLACLMHFCDRAGISFATATNKAQAFYSDEAEEYGAADRDGERFDR